MSRTTRTGTRTLGGLALVALVLMLATPAAARQSRREREAEQARADQAAVAAGTCPALPRSRTETKAQARRFYALGIARAGQDQLAEAMTALRCSFAAYPHPDTFYNHAKIAERLSRFEEAIRSYKKYLELARRARDRTEIEEKIEILEKTLLQKQRELEAKQREAEVKRLAEQLAREKLAAQEKAQREEAVRRQAEADRQAAELRARMEKLKAERAAERLSLERREVELKLAGKRRRFQTAAWIIGGAGVAALIAGGALGGVALADKARVENGAQDTPWAGGIAEAYQRSRALGTASYVAAGAGGLLVISAGVIYALSRRVTLTAAERTAPAATRLRLRLVPGPGAAGAGLGFSF